MIGSCHKRHNIIFIELRYTCCDSDRGHLWEHLVLDELRAVYPDGAIHYWRDKSQREIDFVIAQSETRVDTIEAKINPDAFDAISLEVFRGFYSKDRNFLMSPFIQEPYKIRKKNFEIHVGQPHQLISEVDPFEGVSA